MNKNHMAIPSNAIISVEKLLINLRQSVSIELTWQLVLGYL